jgi:cytoskeletal protein RodZ
MKHIIFKLLITIAFIFPILSAAQKAPFESITGKSGNVQTATPITSAATVDETTAGYQTEAGAIQERGISAKPSTTPRGTAIQPLRPDQAGQSQQIAETGAQAAAMAEMYPGTTLGVDLQSAPPSPAQSVAEARQHLAAKSHSTPKK